MIGATLVTLLFFVALGLLNAYAIGAPWYIGLAIGIVIGFIACLGFIPVVGVLLYHYVAGLLMNSLVWLPWVYWAGLILSVVYTILALAMVLAMVT